NRPETRQIINCARRTPATRPTPIGRTSSSRQNRTFGGSSIRSGILVASIESSLLLKSQCFNRIHNALSAGMTAPQQDGGAGGVVVDQCRGGLRDSQLHGHVQIRGDAINDLNGLGAGDEPLLVEAHSPSQYGRWFLHALPITPRGVQDGVHHCPCCFAAALLPRALDGHRLTP